MVSAQRKALTCRSRAIKLEVNTCKRVAVDALCTLHRDPSEVCGWLGAGLGF